MLGYTRDELIGTNLADYLTPESIETSMRARKRELAGEITGPIYEQEFIARDGHSVILEVSRRVIVENGRPVAVQGICRDITARKQAEIDLRRLSELNRHQALHDHLTGLPNRGSFGQQVEHAIGVADKDGSQLAVLLMDLDRFKEINDTLGHRYGDLLLVELARRLESVLRRSDTVARLGGDEFGILVRQLSASDVDLEQALERILAALEQPFQVDGLPLHVEASIGIARFPAHGRDVDLPAPARRRRHVPRQGDRRAARALRSGARPPRRGGPDAALGAASRDPQPRARAALPAQARRSRRASWPASRRSCAGSIRRAA